MTEQSPPPDAEITLRRISALTVWDVCELSNTLSPEHRGLVADNGASIAQAHFSEIAWMRAIYADETLVGFVMLHIGADYDDGIDCPGAFLWRLMIGGPFQRKGYGEKALAIIVRDLKAQGFTELFTSYGQEAGNAEGFYKHLGFVTTGEMYDDEVEAVLKF